CDLCGSWNLLPLGIGVERVCEELTALFPDAPLVRFDTDSIRTPAMARKAVEAFEVPGSIAVGTEFMLPWLSSASPLQLAVVASADSLLALPFWRSRERFLRILLTLREKAEKTIVATRRMDDSALHAAEHPEEESFFEEEAALRRALGYPPYGTLLTVSSTGSRDQLEKAATRITEIAGANSLHSLPEKGLVPRGFMRTWVVQLPEGVWPEATLSRALSGLPPSFRVLIDPDSLQ
ncbi:hypothetical protein KKD81_02270, partial [Patescibacteria group bacterium]|nr:hypothetical protein [Patescibacteria group bacterium]